MQNRRDFLNLSCASILAAPLASAAHAAKTHLSWADTVDAAGAAAVKAGTTAGLVIAVVKDGRVIHSRGYGFANLETRTAANESSIFRIASVTKSFTATAIMLLNERGALGIDTPLARFYPKIAGSSGVTIGQMLSHTSGIRDYVRGGLPADALAWKTADEFAHGVERMSPLYDFDPGTRYSYSNSGYVLLGGIIEKASGASYSRFLEENIFKPAGMLNTAVDSVEDVVRNRADGYSLRDGKPGAFRHADFIGMPFSAGAVRSTASDMARWSRAFFGGEIVRPETVRQMTAPAKVANGAAVADARWWPPDFTPRPPPNFVTQDNYGFGWSLTHFHGRPTANHSGGINGFNSIVIHYLDEDLSLILLANTDNGIIAPFEALIKAAGEQR